MEDNMFKTEADVLEFLVSRGSREDWKNDYGIRSLLSFQYGTPQTKLRACEALTAYIENRLRDHQSDGALIELNTHILRIAPFLEAAAHVPALEPLMRLRNRIEARDYQPGCYGYEMVVAVRNAIETLRGLAASPSEPAE